MILARVCFAAVLILAAFDTQAQTVTRSLGINPYGAHIGADATFGGGIGGGGGLGAIIMPSSASVGGLSRFAVAFTIPDDYAPNTAMRLRVIWRSSAVSCDINLLGNFMYWAAPGQPNKQGFLLRQTALLAPDSADISMETYFSLSFTSMSAFAPGDAIVLGLYRNTSIGSPDTCHGDLYIQGLSIEYQALAEADIVFRNGFEAII